MLLEWFEAKIVPIDQDDKRMGRGAQKLIAFCIFNLLAHMPYASTQSDPAQTLLTIRYLEPVLNRSPHIASQAHGTLF